MSVKDMTNAEISGIKVLRRVANDKYGNAMWECVCNCGKVFEACGQSLRNGHTKSCGHLQRDAASALNKTHGLSKTQLYKAWAGIKDRCYNPNNDNYAHYGAKGISLCSEWHDFAVFHKWAMENGYQKGLTIERKNNSEGYNPDNCYWATRTIQNRNTTRTHRIIDGDRILTAAEAARIAGVSRSTVAEWCRNGEIKTLADVIAKEKAINNGRHKKGR